MQNKKLLSVLLSLVLVCTCIAGMLILNASGEARTAPHPVELVDGSIAETLNGFDVSQLAANEYVEITLDAGVSVDAEIDENGLLFGLETIFVGNERLPITIKGEGSITFENVTAGQNVACANNYTFEGIDFLAADAANPFNFYAGSGEVKLVDVALTSGEDDLETEDVDESVNPKANVKFYADNFTTAAFAGWESDHIAAAKGTGTLIPTSLTLEGVDYSWAEYAEGKMDENYVTDTKGINRSLAYVGAIGWTDEEYVGATGADLVKASDTSATINLTDVTLDGFVGRTADADSPVALMNVVVNDSTADNTGTTIIDFVGLGIGTINSAGAGSTANAALPNFDCNITINGGTFGVTGKTDSNTMIARGVAFTGNLTTTINGGHFYDSVMLGYGDGASSKVYGCVTANLNGGTFDGVVYGTQLGSMEFAEDDPNPFANFVTIKDATIAQYQGTRVGGDVKTTVESGSTITTYYGCYNSSSAGMNGDITNVINGGTITTFYGTGGAYYREEQETGKVDPEDEESVTDYVPFHPRYILGNIVNEFNGGTIGTAYGAGNCQTIVNLTNTLNGTKFTKFFGTYSNGWKNQLGDDAGTYYISVPNITGTFTTEITGSDNNLNLEATASQYEGQYDSFNANCHMLGSYINIDGDVVFTIGDENGTVRRSFANGALVYTVGGNANAPYLELCSVKNATLNINCVYTGGEPGHFNVDVVEDMTVNIRNSRFNSHMQAVGTLCEIGGDMNCNVIDSHFSKTSSKVEWRRFTVVGTDVGGDLNVLFDNVAAAAATDVLVSGTGAGANTLPCVGVEQDGNVTVTLKDCTFSGLYDGIRANVGGKYHQIFEGTNNIADGFPEINYNVGTLETTIAGTFKVGNTDYFATNPYYGNTGTGVVGEVINNIKAGAALKKGFYGTGAATINVGEDGYVIPVDAENGTLYTGSPVGTFTEVKIPLTEDDPATEDVDEATYDVKYTYTPGNVTNNVYGGTVGIYKKNGTAGVDTTTEARFLGTGEQTINKVTTNMYGGTIYRPFGTSSTLSNSNGCYFGNYGPVLESVNNNIYGGSIGYNFFGSNGDLTCAVNTTVGASFYNGDVDLATLSFTARPCFAGGNAGSYTFTDGVVSGWTKNADVTGKTGPVKIRINLNTPETSKTLAVSAFLYNCAIQNGTSADYAVDISVVDTSFGNHSDFNCVGTTDVEGNVKMNFENVKYTNASRRIEFLNSVKGNVEWSMNGVEYTATHSPNSSYIQNVEGNVTATFKDVTFASKIEYVFIQKVSGNVEATIEDILCTEDTTLAALYYAGGDVNVTIDNVYATDADTQERKAITDLRPYVGIFADDEDKQLGDVTVTVKNVSATAGVRFVENVTVAGDLTCNVENVDLASYVELYYNNGAKIVGEDNSETPANLLKGDLIVNIGPNEAAMADGNANGLTVGGDFAFVNAASDANYTQILGDIYATVENATFNAKMRDVAINNDNVDSAASVYAKYTRCTFAAQTQLANRAQTINGKKPQHMRIELDSCTITGNVAAHMQSGTASTGVYVYGDTVIGAEGAETDAVLAISRRDNNRSYIGAKYSENGPVPTPTTITLYENGALYGNRGDGISTKGIVAIYDVTVKGTGLFAACPDGVADVEGEDATLGYQYNTDNKGSLTLKGNLAVPNGENPQIYLNAAEETASVSPAAGDNWIDPTEGLASKIYVNIVGVDAAAQKAVLDKIAPANLLGCTNNGYRNYESFTIYGVDAALNVEKSLMVSMDLKERIYIKLWLPVANVQAYFDGGFKNMQGLDALDVGATLDELKDGETVLRPARDLGWTTITKADFDENKVTIESAEGVDYVVVNLGSVASNDFNTNISFFASQQAVLNIAPEAPYTMLDFAKKGVELYKNKEGWKNLFNALYNYGASACELPLLAASDVEGVETVIDKEFVVGAMDDLEVVGLANKEGVLNFKTVSLLMGDAIGYRFRGQLADPEAKITKDDIVLKVNDQATTNYALYVEEDGFFAIDVYVSFDHVAEELDFEITAFDASLKINSSLKGYSEQVIEKDGDMTLALAQLVQAVYNDPSAEN